MPSRTRGVRHDAERRAGARTATGAERRERVSYLLKELGTVDERNIERRDLTPFVYDTGMRTLPQRQEPV